MHYHCFCVSVSIIISLHLFILSSSRLILQITLHFVLLCLISQLTPIAKLAKYYRDHVSAEFMKVGNIALIDDAFHCPIIQLFCKSYHYCLIQLMPFSVCVFFVKIKTKFLMDVYFYRLYWIGELDSGRCYLWLHFPLV